jgi:hypothetical protein
LFADAIWKLAHGPHQVTVEDAGRGIAAAERTLETVTLEPGWQRATDRHVELLAAIAVSIDAPQATAEYATSPEISDALDRTVNTWSEHRIELINEGDIYAPARGRLAFTVPTYASYILRHYEARRAEARVELTPLSAMYQRARSQERSRPGHPER